MAIYPPIFQVYDMNPHAPSLRGCLCMQSYVERSDFSGLDNVFKSGHPLRVICHSLRDGGSPRDFLSPEGNVCALQVVFKTDVSAGGRGGTDKQRRRR